MFSQVFGSVEVMSALILGCATLGAAALNLYQEARKAKRAARESAAQRGWLRRPLLVLAIAIVVTVGGLAYATDSVQANAHTFARRMLPDTRAKPTATKANTAISKPPAPRPTAIAPRVAAPSSEKSAGGKLEDWLQSEGTKIYYRYTRYLPDACPGAPIAIGNWADGEARPVPMRCLEDGWIALDLGPLVQEGRMVPNMTYCVNFRAASGAWGIHVPERAPQMDSVAVPAVRVPLGRAIGVRYLPGNPRERVVPTSATPRAQC